MEKKYMERLLGKYCKIVTKEPGEKRASVVTGTLEDVDYDDGFVLVDSSQGLGCLRISTIVAIKPGRRNKNKHNKRNYKHLKKDTKAIVGIGTLIVFIAMILVAAVAASIIIQTSETLQQRAQSVGTQTIREVSAGIVIDGITGYTNSNKTVVEYIAFTVRPRAGSKDIDLSLCTIEVLYDELHLLTLNESLVTEVNTNDTSVFDTPLTTNFSQKVLDLTSKTKFAVISIHDPDDSVINTNGINSGDRVYIIVNASALIEGDGGLLAREAVTGSIKPETGAPGVFDVTSPAVFSKRIVTLW